MRYGIMAAQPETLMPPGSSARELLTAYLTFDHADLVRRVASYGFNLIELSGDLGMLHPPAFSNKAIRKLTDLKSRLGLSYTVHLPFWSLEHSSPLDSVREAAVKATIDLIRITRPLEPEVYVFHATGAMAADFCRMGLPEAARPFVLRKFQSKARDSVKDILAKTGLPSRRLAVETIEFPFSLTLELAEDLDLSICLDTGHILAGYSGPIDLFAALEESLPRLAEIHLHDSPWQGPDEIVRYGQDHQALGRGDLDVAGLHSRLEQAGFDGPVIFELSISEALDSLGVIERVRQVALVS